MVRALSSSDVGSRVVVRRKVGPLYTDLLGYLKEITNDAVVVLTDSGEVRVPLDEVHRAKRIPPNPIARLEEAAASAWPAVEVQWLGQWRLRASSGYTGRANSVLPLGYPGMPLPQAVEHAEEFYRARGLPARIDIPLPLSARVVPAVTQAGWRVDCEVLIQTIALDRLIAATTGGCTLSATPSPAALAIISGRHARRIIAGPAGDLPRGDPADLAGAPRTLPEAAMHVLTAVPQLQFAEYAEPLARPAGIAARSPRASAESGSLLAMGRGAVTDGYLGLFAVETVEAARRQGLAQRIVGTLARWADSVGASTAYLQVESTNTSAIALYEKLGFRTHHRYVRYRKD